MRPFLLLASRTEEVAAESEYQAMLRFGELEARDLHRIRLEAGPLPALDLADYSGIIVGGSPFNSADPPNIKSPTQLRVEADLRVLLDEVVARDFPFFGACYGVGTLGTHQGAVIDDTYGEAVAAVTIRLTEAGRLDPLLANMPNEFQAFVGHKEAVHELPPHVTVLASSDTCPVQMFRVKENLYATQFHPELDLDGVITRVGVYRDHGYFPPGEIDAVIARLRATSVWAPQQILTAFVRRYTRP